jgi:transcriptional regulator with XRE-family HTH domain
LISEIYYDKIVAGGKTMKLGEVIKRLRLEKKMSQKELGERIGKTSYLISAIERGVVSPSIDTLTEIARVFDKPLSEIFLEVEEDLTENPSITVLMSQIGKLSKEEQSFIIDMLAGYISKKKKDR